MTIRIYIYTCSFELPIIDVSIYSACLGASHAKEGSLTKLHGKPLHNEQKEVRSHLLTDNMTLEWQEGVALDQVQS